MDKGSFILSEKMDTCDGGDNNIRAVDVKEFIRLLKDKRFTLRRDKEINHPEDIILWSDLIKLTGDLK